MPQRTLRDFIYLDVERLKSIIAQMEGGVVDSHHDSRRESEEVSSSIEAGLMGFLRGVVGGRYLEENEEAFTRTLHDDIYNKVENVLIDTECLAQIPGDYDCSSDNFSLREALADNWYVLITGKVNVHDYNRMKDLIAHFNDLASFIAICSVSSLPEGTSKKIKEEQFRTIKRGFVQDDEYMKGLALFFDIFYKDRIVIKILPIEGNTEIRFCGNINPAYLREDIASIIYKYGTAPVAKWKIFGQIASIPPADRSNLSIAVDGGSIDSAIHSLFNAFREIEIMAQSVAYPEIAITPIAIYREVVLQTD